jgi:hypothetical protein
VADDDLSFLAPPPATAATMINTITAPAVYHGHRRFADPDAGGGGGGGGSVAVGGAGGYHFPSLASQYPGCNCVSLMTAPQIRRHVMYRRTPISF